MELVCEPHPLLSVDAFVTRFPSPLTTFDTKRVMALLALDAPAPLKSDDAVRSAIRDLLRHGGYKPTGRGKPASEYLIRAVTENALGSINLAVDACNVVSLHSGLPISVVDVGKTKGQLRVGIAPEGSSYVFNLSGQTIDAGGLLCVFDEDGPCANAVKDAQRTKTSPDTTATISVIWGSRALGERAQQAGAWYRALLQEHGAVIEPVEVAA